MPIMYRVYIYLYRIKYVSGDGVEAVAAIIIITFHRLYGCGTIIYTHTHTHMYTE